MMASIRQMLAPDGVFLFEAQYLLDIIDKILLGTVFHEHMSHHSLKPLKQFMERHGMQLIDVERNNIQMGSIIGFAQPVGGPRKVQPAVGEMLALEEQRKLDKPESVKQFAVKLGTLRKKVDALVADWKKKGATVAGYGTAPPADPRSSCNSACKTPSNTPLTTTRRKSANSPRATVSPCSQRPNCSSASPTTSSSSPGFTQRKSSPTTRNT